MPEEEGELVGSGGFRVAGQRALEVLRSAQLGKTFWRPLLWLRAAAALGAKRMAVTTGVRSVTFSFDGRPLPRALISDPLALFTGDDGTPTEARWLAYALVHTLEPDLTVTLSSGRGRDRKAFRFDSTGHGEPVEPAPGEGTVVQAAWFAVLTATMDKTRPWAWFAPDKASAYPRLEAADAVPFPLKTPLGDVSPWEARKSLEGAVYRDGGRRVQVILGGGRRLAFHHLGVRVGGVPLEDLALPMAVDVDDPGLTLDASLNAPVEDRAYHACVAAGRDAAVRHGSARLERHAKNMSLCAKLLTERPALRDDWRSGSSSKALLSRGVPWATAALNALRGRPLRGDSLRVYRTARFAAFLRDNAMSALRGKSFDARLPLGLALWDAPVLVSATGAPLSLADLDLDERRCSVWDEAGPAPAGVGAMMVWALGSAERAFVERFPTRRARLG